MLIDSLKFKLRNFWVRRMRQRCKNRDFTLIANNCIAGVVLHDLGVRFDTPTVNLFIKFPGYISFLKNVRQMIEREELVEITPPPNSSGHPVGRLGDDVVIDFLHYSTFDEAKQAWEKRKRRIHWDNLYVVLVERDGCTVDDLKAFDALEFKHKVALVHRPVEGIGCAHVMRGFERESEVGDIFGYCGSIGHRVYDQFDWSAFLNRE